MRDYQVIVGNIGTVYSGADRAEAERVHGVYADKSLNHEGRAAGESVVTSEDGEIIIEFAGCLENV